MDRMAFGASDVLDVGGSRALPKCIWVPTHTLTSLGSGRTLSCRPGADLPTFSPQQPKGRCQVAAPRGFHCAGCWLGLGPQLPHREGLGSPQPPPAPPPSDPTRVGVFASKLPSVWMEDHIPRQVSLWISLLMSDFSGKDDRVSGLRDTVWLSTFSSRNRVVLIPGWLMRSGSGQASRPFFLRNGAAATQPAVLTPRSCFLRHTYPISYPHPNKAH